MPELWCFHTNLPKSVEVQQSMRCVLEANNASNWKTWEPRRKVKGRGWPVFAATAEEA